MAVIEEPFADFPKTGSRRSTPAPQAPVSLQTVGSIPGIGSIVFPVSGHDSGSIGSVPGDPRDGGSRLHKGVDIFAPSGTAVVSTVDGVVVAVGGVRLGGQRVGIQDKTGNYHYYAHLSGYVDGIQIGAQVAAGQPIGFVGKTGNAASTDPHLHYSINEGGSTGKPLVDPVEFLSNANLVTITDPTIVQTPSEHEADGSVGNGSRAADLGPVKVPDNGRVVDVGGQRYILYQALIGDNNLWVSYRVDREADLSRLSDFPNPDQLSTEQFAAINAVDGGSVSELGPIAERWTTFQDFFSETLNLQMGGNPAAEDSGVIRVILEYVARPDMTDDELKARLEQTEWWQTHTDAQLDWNDLSGAEQEKRVNDEASRLAQLWFTYVGETKSVSDPDILEWARQIASGEIGIGFWTETVAKEQALLNPESPHSRRLRDEERSQLRDGIDAENLAATVRDLAHRWGVQLSDDAIQKWGTDLQSLTASQDDLTEYLKQQAQILYPLKDPELETSLYVQPWLQTYRRTLEKEADLFNPQIQKALQNGLTAFDFEQQLRESDEWLTTGNAQDEFQAAGLAIGRQMGFV